MKNKTFFMILIGLFVFSALAIAVSAQDDTGIIGSVLGPFGRLEVVYAKFAPVIDAMIYLIIFLGLAQVTLGKHFEYKKGGRAVVIGVGVILAVGLSLFGVKAGFSIASFGPIAAIILLALMGYAFYAGITSLEIEGANKLTVVAIAYLLFYYGIQATVPNVITSINARVPVVGGLLALLAAAFAIYAIIMIVSFIISLFKGGEKATEEPTRGVRALKPEGRKETKETGKLEDELDLILSRLHTARDHLHNLKGAIAKLATAAGGWADAYKGKPIDAGARTVAAGLVKLIETQVTPHFDKAKDDLMDAITQAKGVMDSAKFSNEVKKRMQKIRHEIEASHDHLINLIMDKRIDKCVEALERLAKGKGTRTPASLSKFIAGHANRADAEIENIRNHLAAIWKEVRDLSDAIKSPAGSSRGIAALK